MIVYKFGLIAAMALLSTDAQAHAGNPSLLQLHLTENAVRGDARLHVMDFRGAIPALARLSPNSTLEDVNAGRRAMADYVAKHIKITRNGASCAGEWALVGQAPDGMMRYTVEMPCKGELLRVRSTLFWEIDSQHRTVISISDGHGLTRSASLSPFLPEIEIILANAGLGATFFQFLKDGVIHIVAGVDHVFFVLGLLLLAGGLNRKTVFAITGFTLAHTLTLALSSLGALSVPSSVVEPVIGASIAYLGIESLLVGAYSRRLAFGFVATHAGVLLACLLGWLVFPVGVQVGLTIFAIGYSGWLANDVRERIDFRFAILPFVFGLVHGLGFAGPLQNLSLPTAPFVAALVGFNLGVEIGQICVIIFAAGIYRGLSQTAFGVPDNRKMELIAAWVLITVGAGWFLLRTLP